MSDAFSCLFPLLLLLLLLTLRDCAAAAATAVAPALLEGSSSTQHTVGDIPAHLPAVAATAVAAVAAVAAAAVSCGAAASVSLCCCCCCCCCLRLTLTLTSFSYKKKVAASYERFRLLKLIGGPRTVGPRAPPHAGGARTPSGAPEECFLPMKSRFVYFPRENRKYGDIYQNLSFNAAATATTQATISKRILRGDDLSDCLRGDESLIDKSLTEGCTHSNEKHRWRCTYTPINYFSSRWDCLCLSPYIYIRLLDD